MSVRSMTRDAGWPVPCWSATAGDASASPMTTAATIRMNHLESSGNLMRLERLPLAAVNLRKRDRALPRVDVLEPDLAVIVETPSAVRAIGERDVVGDVRQHVALLV